MERVWDGDFGSSTLCWSERQASYKLKFQKKCVVSVGLTFGILAVLGRSRVWNAALIHSAYVDLQDW